MERQKSRKLRNLYLHTLLDDVVPFWMRHSLDFKYGGYLHYLDRDGTVFNTDKGVWLQGRATWMFARLYNTIGRNQEWLDAARLGYDFLVKYCFDDDGRMFFEVTRDGKPLRKRRYLFSETFAILGLLEYFRASADRAALELAKKLYRLVVQLHRKPDETTPPKIIPDTRITKSLSMRMMLLCVTQEIRSLDSDPLYEEVVNDALFEILNNFRKPDKHALLENVGPKGEPLDSPEGRCVNPGHSVEVSWFIIHEGISRDDSSLIEAGLEILNWSLDLGWDNEYGGILYFIDIEDKPLTQLEWDMKLWWPHTEALCATLLAYHLTHEENYLNWHERISRYAFKHFPDHEYGEWFAYLHRDGTVANRLKGSLWKGPFHLSRALLQCVQILDQMS